MMIGVVYSNPEGVRVAEMKRMYEKLEQEVKEMREQGEDNIDDGLGMAGNVDRISMEEILYALRNLERVRRLAQMG